jgi:hypothetical protein
MSASNYECGETNTLKSAWEASARLRREAYVLETERRGKPGRHEPRMRYGVAV